MDGPTIGLINEDETAPEDESSELGGGKTIGFFASIFLIINNITGPGLPAMPYIFQSAGWVIPSIVAIFTCLISILGSGMICEAMRLVKGNEGFRGRVEFAALTNYYLGFKAYILAQIFVTCALQITNIASIIVVAQVFDETIIYYFNRTGAIQFYPTFGWEWYPSMFSNNVYVLSLGFMVTLLMVIPMGYFNLDDNMIIQIVCFILTLSIWIGWIGSFIYVMTDLREFHPIPAFGLDQTQVLGTIIFNYAFVVTIPSWCNEKRNSVSIYPSVASASLFATAVYFLIGILGALAFSIPENDDVLDVLNESPFSNRFTRLSAFIYPIVSIASSIPVYSIVIKYNLLETGLVNNWVAWFISAVVPWLVVIPFYTGSGLANVMNWGSLFFVSITNFIIPFIIYIAARMDKNKKTKFEVTEIDRQDDYPETVHYYCGYQTEETPAPVHFALPRSLHYESVIVVSFVLLISVSIICLGTIIMNILASVFNWS